MKLAAIVLLLAALASASVEHRTRLVDEATVRGKYVRLSDLLPRNEPMYIYSVAQKIILGHAPQPGSFRVFTAKEIASAAAPNMKFEIPARIVVRRAGWPLDLESLRQALARSEATQQFDLSRAQIFPPPNFTTVVVRPRFEVLSASKVPDTGALDVVLRCHERSACGSFLVRITGLKNGLSTTEPTNSHTPDVHGLGAGAPLSGPVLVQPSETALLVIQEDGLRITEPVMPVRRARLGQTVRVVDRVTHRSMFAEVTGFRLLRPASDGISTQMEQSR